MPESLALFGVLSLCKNEEYGITIQKELGKPEWEVIRALSVFLESCDANKLFQTDQRTFPEGYERAGGRGVPRKIGDNEVGIFIEE